MSGLTGGRSAHAEIYQRLEVVSTRAYLQSVVEVGSFHLHSTLAPTYTLTVASTFTQLAKVDVPPPQRRYMCNAQMREQAARYIVELALELPCKSMHRHVRRRAHENVNQPHLGEGLLKHGVAEPSFR